MKHKCPVRPDRLRLIPEQFSWVDHRLVRDCHIELISHQAATLYLFLLTVGDHQGLSYYSEFSIGKRIGMNSTMLIDARDELIRTELIAFKSPIYQVLTLDPVACRSTLRISEPMALPEILQHIMGGGR